MVHRRRERKKREREKERERERERGVREDTWAVQSVGVCGGRNLDRSVCVVCTVRCAVLYVGGWMADSSGSGSGSGSSSGRETGA